ncbi:MAG: phosphate regulon transcriptional regulatory protein PhoB [Myxococcales bacterium]|nr:phosphate regulon transcriptional regulatory protein PhoB [Myxococcales bacterium]
MLPAVHALFLVADYAERMTSDLGPVLIVDDERDLRTLVDFNLRQAGFTTAHAANGAEALARARSLHPRVIILDLNLPDVSGMDVCRLLRADPATKEVPILMLTARGSEPDRVQGLELGADDYLAKPFNLRELILRVASVARRRKEVTDAPRQRLVAGGIALDLDAHLCFVDDAELPLTLQEFRLLVYLIQGRGRVRTRDDLLADVWNTSPDLETRTVDTHVKRLRDKLGRAGDIIETVRGVGYRVREPGADATG